MKAVVCTRYGPPEVLRIENVEKPRPRPDEVLVRVHAAAVSVSDCLIRSAKVKPAMWLPFRIFVGFTRPRQPILGIELSGQIESVGANVSLFKPGDSIIGYTGRRFGACAQYVCLLDGGRFMPTDSLIAPKPRNISDAEAATVPTRATLKPGHNVLVYGAAGGIGTFAVQLAKNAGANVTAVCSAANFDLVKSLGAVNVID